MYVKAGVVTAGCVQRQWSGHSRAHHAVEAEILLVVFQLLVFVEKFRCLYFEETFQQHLVVFKTIRDII